MFANESNVMPIPCAPLVPLGRFVRNLRPRLVVHDEAVMSMSIRHACDVGIIEVGAILEIIENAHVTMSVLLARLLKLSL